MISKDNIMKHLRELVCVRSVSGTEGERLGAEKLVEIIGRLPYFKANPENLKQIPLENDYLQRSVVSAFVGSKAPTPRTVVITGHYDVVGVEEYGHLGGLAFDMDNLPARLSELSLDDDAKKDLASGKWLFGRGTGDMKYGDALCIETLRYFTEEEDLGVNLLYLGVPGEETNSEGMLRAVKILYDLQRDEGLEFIIMIDAEAYYPDETDPDAIRYIHIGSSGKLMPLFFFCGVGTHAGELVFNGLDANLMASELHRLLHHNSRFCQQGRGKTTPPPACLKMGDLKDSYNITTPIYAASYYNLITLDLDVNDLTEKLIALATEAFENTLKLDGERTDVYEKITGEKALRKNYKPKVMLFKDLYRLVKEGYEGDFDAYIRGFTSRLIAEGAEIQDVSIRLFKEVADRYPDKSPMIVLGFIPPYYPDNYPDDDREETKTLRKAVAAIAEYAENTYGEKLRTKDYYMGISDMCYAGLNEDYDYDRLFDNIVGAGDYYQFPAEAMKGIHIPAIIFGPYSKDLHMCSERVEIPYSFDVLPDLFVRFVKEIGGNN